MYYLATWINAFPPSIGVSREYIPRDIMIGTSLDFRKHCKLEFGEYDDTHEDIEPSNNMVPRNRSCICMVPSFNQQGGYKIYCIQTRRHVIRKKWTKKNMPGLIKEQINLIGK